ncbi:MAG TPA: hypothetical protein VHS54_12435, partial [Jatrophihabitans sp.]|jgi:hypothetical protein|nr:hypothetical protein [Jatrophihabitans sp.]
MQADGRARPDARLRAVAALIVCLLGLTLVTTVHAAQGYRHATGGVAMVTAATAHAQSAPSRADQATLGASPVITAAVIRWPSTADSSRSASPLTAQTPPVRGPPPQALS